MLLEILRTIALIIGASFCIVVIIAGFRHTGPDERNSMTRYNQPDNTPTDDNA